jgi:hypothetical protein
MQVVFDPNLKGTPAQVDHKTGIVSVNHEFTTMKPAMKAFVLAHEEAHYKAKTFDEMEADRLAFKKVGTKKNALDILNGISQGLPWQRHPASARRVKQIMDLSLKLKNTPESMKLYTQMQRPDPTVFNQVSNWEFMGIGKPSARQAAKAEYKAKYGGMWRQYWKADKETVKNDSLSNEIEEVLGTFGGIDTKTIVIISALAAGLVLWLVFKKKK